MQRNQNSYKNSTLLLLHAPKLVFYLFKRDSGGKML